MRKHLAAAAAAVLVLPMAAHSQEFEPNAARTIALDGFSGIAYYTLQPEGAHLVATVNAGENILRVVSILADGQSLLLAVPGPLGGDDKTLRFARTGDRIDAHEVLGLALAN